MAWHLTDDLGTFDAAAGGYLRGDPVAHTGNLSILDMLHRRGRHAFGPADPLFGWWTGESGAVAGAFVLTPPYPLLFAETPDAALPELVARLRAADPPGPPVDGVSGTTRTAEEFARLWTAAAGGGSHVVQNQRLFRLGTLVPPDPAPAGAARLADAGDRPLLVAFVTEFGRESGLGVADPEAQVDARLATKSYMLWEVDGEPVAMAGITPAIAGVARIAPVYTPPEHRGHGYGSAVTAARTAAALANGADEVVLFTDLANPTSNAIYQRLGYLPVEDRVILGFTAPEGAESGA